MLNIYLDNCREDLPKEFESYVSQYFDEVYEPEWFSDDFVRRIIKTIDKSEVVGIGNSINIFNDITDSLIVSCIRRTFR